MSVGGCNLCQSQNPPDSNYCPSCGRPLVWWCVECGEQNSEGRQICQNCGIGLPTFSRSGSSKYESPKSYTPAHLAETILTSRHTIEGERKVVTVLFCDLVNSTSLVEQLGPDEMHLLLNNFFDLGLQKIHHYSGTINQFLGDGFMALFGAPIAFGDHAKRAVLAALEFQQAMKEQENNSDLPTQFRVFARVALNTGPVVVGKIGDNLRMDYTAIGSTTNAAARVMQLADGGDVYITEETYRLVAEYVDAQGLGQHKLKGISQPVQIYKIMGVRDSERAADKRSRYTFRAAFVGRRHELSVMSDRLDRLLGGEGSLICVTGEGGIGKSRLLKETRQRMSNQNVLWLEGHPPSLMQGGSYSPFLEILRTFFAISPNSSEPVAQEKVETRIRELFSPPPTGMVRSLARLLGLPVDDREGEVLAFIEEQSAKRQIFLNLRRLFARIAQESPVLLIFEDAHWLDDTSHELLEFLLPLAESHAIAICWLGRPESQGPHYNLRHAAQQNHPSRFLELNLDPLPSAEEDILVQSLFDTGHIPALARELISGKAGGNPFFIEEVTRSLIDRNILVREEASGEWRIIVEAGNVQIPETLKGIIAERVDRLTDEVKLVAKLAAVLGRSFFPQVLRAVLNHDPQLDHRLHELEVAGLILKRRDRQDSLYVFRHALIQEAIYETILLHRRRELHHQIAKQIELLFTEQLDDLWGTLAYHYARAEQWDKAQLFLMKAGDHAIRIAADGEALSNYMQAFAACSKVFGDRWDSLQRASLEGKIGEALFRRGSYPEAAEYLMRAGRTLGLKSPTQPREVRWGIVREMVRHLGNLLPLHRKRRSLPESISQEDLLHILLRLPWIDFYLNQEKFLFDILRLLNFSQQQNFVPGIAVGSSFIGVMCDLLLLTGLGDRYLRYAADSAAKDQNQISKMIVHFCIGIHEQNIRGQLGSALNHYKYAITCSKDIGELRGWATISFWASWVVRLQGKFDESAEINQSVIKAAKEADDPHAWGYGLCGLGQVQLDLGETEDAIDSLEEAVFQFKRGPAYGCIAVCFGLLGRCYLQMQQNDRAINSFKEALALIAKYGLHDFTFHYIDIGMAEAYLRIAEQTSGQDHLSALSEAKAAIRKAERRIKLSAEIRIQIVRIRGLYEWLKGKPSKARVSWEDGRIKAEQMGAPLFSAMILLDMGKYMRRDDLVAEASEKLQSLGWEPYRIQEMPHP